jgi:hypothetical protein
MNGIPSLINEVLAALGHAPHLFTDPIFLIRLAETAVEVATAPDDETRRGIAQAGILRLEREFAK